MRWWGTVSGRVGAVVASLILFVAVTSACTSEDQPLSEEGKIKITVETASAQPNTPSALAAYSAESAEITTLEFKTLSQGSPIDDGSGPRYAAPLLDTAVMNSQVEDLYRATLALPLWPSDRRSCPVDVGVIYALKFLAGSRLVMTGTLQGGGCTGLAISGAPGPLALFAWSPDYWALLESTLGLPPRTLH